MTRTERWLCPRCGFSFPMTELAAKVMCTCAWPNTPMLAVVAPGPLRVVMTGE